MFVDGCASARVQESESSSAKFSIRRWELDVGWLYIRLLQALGMARVVRVAPQPLKLAPGKHVDIAVLRAVIVARMHMCRGSMHAGSSRRCFVSSCDAGRAP
jgi:hypothetical protein